MCFYFSKNALSTLAFSVFVKELCGSNWSCAFFVRSFGCALFLLCGGEKEYGKYDQRQF